MSFTAEIDVVRSLMVEEAEARQAKVDSLRQADLARKEAQYKMLGQAFEEGRALTEEAQITERFAELNQEFFRGRGQTHISGSHYGIWSGKSLQVGWETTFHTWLEGQIGKNNVHIDAKAVLETPLYECLCTPKDPFLKISCSRQIRWSLPRRLFMRVLEPGLSEWYEPSNYALRVNSVEGQEEPIKEWQNPDLVKQAFARVLIEQHLV